MNYEKKYGIQTNFNNDSGESVSAQLTLVSENDTAGDENPGNSNYEEIEELQV